MRKLINDIDEELLTTENTANFGSELDMYYEIESNYKKHTNTYVGTYILNNTYSLKKLKYVAKNILILNIVKKFRCN